jgi:undecaprenyl-diphosphatase
MTYIQAIILGGLQGVTELFPISSLGHSVILPHLLGWHINQGDNGFLIFLVTTHLATALVLLGFFFNDWILICKGVLRSIKNRVIDPSDTYAKLAWLLVVASIPVGILGLLLEEKLKHLFASPFITAFFLIGNGIMLCSIESYKKKNRTVVLKENSEDRTIAQLTWKQSIQVGLAQCLALIPGFSRTGATLGGGLLTGLPHESAARFSFLLATPIIFAAALLKLPELLMQNVVIERGPLLLGFLVSGVAAYFSIRFLTRYFEHKTLTPFGIYCISAGSTSVLFLLFFQW